MPENIPHDSDVSALVSFAADHGQIQSSFMRPLTIVTPPMLTAFPRLGPNQLDENGNVKAPELDLTMRGAQDPQEKFKGLMDQFDDTLRDFVHQNQSLLGKKGLNITQVEMAQRRLFKPRISTKTGRQYPDVCVVRYKGRDTPLEVVDKDLNLINLKENPDAVSFNTIVRAILKYVGGYCRGGSFGNSWELLCVQVLGQATTPGVTDSAAELFSAVPPATEDGWPSLQ